MGTNASTAVNLLIGVDLLLKSCVKDTRRKQTLKVFSITLTMLIPMVPYRIIHKGFGCIVPYYTLADPKNINNDTINAAVCRDPTLELGTILSQ